MDTQKQQKDMSAVRFDIDEGAGLTYKETKATITEKTCGFRQHQGISNIDSGGNDSGDNNDKQDGNKKRRATSRLAG